MKEKRTVKKQIPKVAKGFLNKDLALTSAQAKKVQGGIGPSEDELRLP